MKKETKELIDKLQDTKTNFCNEEDHGLINFIVVWLMDGYIEAIKQPYVLSWVKNLKDGECVSSKNKLYFNPEEEKISISMLMASAKGYI